MSVTVTRSALERFCLSQSPSKRPTNFTTRTLRDVCSRWGVVLPPATYIYGEIKPNNPLPGTAYRHSDGTIGLALFGCHTDGFMVYEKACFFSSPYDPDEECTMLEAHVNTQVPNSEFLQALGRRDSYELTFASVFKELPTFQLLMAKLNSLGTL